jgi:hypothetical protein
MKLTSAVLAILPAMLLTACSQAGEPASPAALSVVEGNGISAERVADGVRITNTTSSRIGYTIWDLGFLGLLGPCDRIELSCPKLGPGESAIVKFGTAGLTGNDHIAVYTWSPLGVPGARVEQQTLVLLDPNAPKPPTSLPDTAKPAPPSPPPPVPSDTGTA